MTDKRWAWSEDGKAITMAGKKFEVAAPKQEEVDEFARIWARSLYSLQMIVRREDAFVLGETGLTEAAEALEALFEQKCIAKARLERACKNVSAFFVPADFHKEFVEAEEISTFIREVVERFGKKE